MRKINAAVVGASGFTGKELLRILSGHENVKVEAMLSRTFASKEVDAVHPELRGSIEGRFIESSVENIPESSDVVFLALPHTKSLEYVPPLLERNMVVIDLSADYRFREKDEYEKWYGKKHSDSAGLKKAVYGLVEINREKIKDAGLVANPGCYATAAILSLYPLVNEGLLKNTACIDAKSGISGAGGKLHEEYLFSKRYENITPYKVNSHRHMGEIFSFIGRVSSSSWESLVFCPHLIPVERGILSNLYTILDSPVDEKEIREVYRSYYKNEKFVNILPSGFFPQTKDTVGTNNCSIGIKCDGKKVVVIAAIDNLIKGAAGQAVQNMNAVFGFGESTGLI